MNRGLGDDVSVQAVAEVNGVDVVAISVESARKFHFHGFGHGDNGGSFPRAHIMRWARVINDPQKHRNRVLTIPNRCT